MFNVLITQLKERLENINEIFDFLNKNYHNIELYGLWNNSYKNIKRELCNTYIDMLGDEE